MKILERFGLQGRTAYVTGGGSGIGRSFCHALAEAGARVAVVDIDKTAAEEVAGELAAAGADTMAMQVDVTDEAQVARMVKTIVDAWGSLTIAVNNAGIGAWHDAMEVSLADWQRIMRLNLDAVFTCSREAGKVMAAAGYGKIINTASMSAHIVNTPQKQAAYNTSKAGVIHLTRSLAAEWATKGVRVNSISPGYTKTMLVEKLLETPEGKTILPEWLEKIPMGRMATTDDLQGALIYLAASVSDYVTGSDLVVDGGYLCW